MITREQAQVLIGFCDAFDLLTGQWTTIEAAMIEAGFDDPENQIEDAKQALLKIA
jgi:hypothetical protein